MKSEYMKHYLSMLVLCNVLIAANPDPVAASHDDGQAKPELDLLRDLETFTPEKPKRQGDSNLARACQRLRINRCRAVSRLDKLLEQIAGEDDDSDTEKLLYIGRQGLDLPTPEINRPATTTIRVYQLETADIQAGEPEDKDDLITQARIVKITKKKATTESNYPTTPLPLQPGTPLPPAVLREGDGKEEKVTTTRAPFFAFAVTQPPERARIINHTYYNPLAFHVTTYSFYHAGPVPGFRMVLHVRRSSGYCPFKPESIFKMRLYESDAFVKFGDYLFEISLEEAHYYSGVGAGSKYISSSITRRKDNYTNEVHYPMEFTMKPIWIRWDGTWIVVGSQGEAILHLYTPAPTRMGIKVGYYGCSAPDYPLASILYYIDLLDEEGPENLKIEV